MTSPLPFHTSHPVTADWHCHRTGDCCHVEAVTMSERERDVLMAFAEKQFTIGKLNTMHFAPAGPLGFVDLVTGGRCPLLDVDAHGLAVCTAYEVRPYNCRRFVCFRPDPKVEPLRMAPFTPYLHFGAVGCANLRERLVVSRVARRLYEVVQRKAQRWALKNGWAEGVL